MKARLIQLIDGQFIRTDFDEKADLVAAMELRGFTFAGFNHNPRQRAELQGAPRFRELAGPMWDGDACDALSA